MKNCVIGAWRMSYSAVNHARLMLNNGESIAEAMKRAFIEIEGDPHIYFAGLGALPNRDGVVELDAAYMNGDTLGFGAVTNVTNLANPFKYAQLLSDRVIDSVRSGESVTDFAKQRGGQPQIILTEEAKKVWQKVRESKLDVQKVKHFGAAGFLGIDESGTISAGLSGADWFMKRSGAISHVAMLGSGCYADSSIGAAITVGSGDDIMKGCLSYEVVRLLSTGISVQQACETALRDHSDKLKILKKKIGTMSIIAIDRMGRFGCATDEESGFMFVASDKGALPVIYVCTNQGFACEVKPATTDEIETYDARLDSYLDQLYHY